MTVTWKKIMTAGTKMEKAEMMVDDVVDEF